MQTGIYTIYFGFLLFSLLFIHAPQLESFLADDAHKSYDVCLIECVCVRGRNKCYRRKPSTEIEIMESMKS